MIRILALVLFFAMTSFRMHKIELESRQHQQ
jgi:hypothetical protein